MTHIYVILYKIVVTNKYAYEFFRVLIIINIVGFQFENQFIRVFPKVSFHEM